MVDEWRGTGVKSVKFVRSEAVGSIILGNPPENELGREFADDLLAAVHEASSSDIRALVIRAEGANFGTGGAIPEWPGKDKNWFRTFIAEVNQAYTAIEALRIPTLAAVQGEVISGHYELVLRADLVIAAESATFAWVESKAGMTALAGGVQRLAERVGRSRAMAQILLAETITATEAKQMGLVHRVVADDELPAAADALGAQLAAGPTRSYAATKALFKAWSNGGVSSADALLLDLSMDLFTTADAQNAFAAVTHAIQAGEAVVPPVFTGE
ncbi:enoyl-CoA hydratase/isomerase family protein [Streptomyces griseoluteus]|jgi:enoyl-CoA hydratase/carnithine racemase|uniref:enoyl-CoA hydratase/isomerase family protein n=1 Tax=Streptomyces TaxID=1883 RepID=UPI000A398053|nr:enoyl-CoA hydratase/isomerase family protein [Streptomyces recifensis]